MLAKMHEARARWYSGKNLESEFVVETQFCLSTLLRDVCMGDNSSNGFWQHMVSGRDLTSLSRVCFGGGKQVKPSDNHLNTLKEIDTKFLEVVYNEHFQKPQVSDDKVNTSFKHCLGEIIGLEGANSISRKTRHFKMAVLKNLA